MQDHRQNRRRFLQTSAALTAGGLAVGMLPRAHGFLAANDRPQIGQIGCGGQGNGITNSATRFGDVIAVCDVDSKRAEEAKAKQGKGKAEIYEVMTDARTQVYEVRHNGQTDTYKSLGEAYIEAGEKVGTKV